MEIETERLVLRELEESDIESLYEVLGDPENMRHYPYTFDEERVRDWISQNRERYSLFGFGLWAVCLKDNGELIGDCGLTMQSINGMIKPEIGYHIHKDHQRKEYAREAAEAVRDWTFTHTPFNAIFSYMTILNRPSAAAAESWGCRLVDEYIDEANGAIKVYAITREEWKSARGHRQ